MAYAQKSEAAGNEVKLLSQAGLTHDFLPMAGLLSEVEGIHLEAVEWVAGKLVG
ncbi:hypothetical protein [Pseudomonas sp. DY-1]|uniref:hypothetical protein n=1 Tax=Pseudomonas sp. DY-1 TaxID=1755504 RepID=UPI003531F252